jgi:type VII secretion integral membrane protein EccD
MFVRLSGCWRGEHVSNAVGEGTGLVRVTVLKGARRADLAVPAGVPVADLLPELVGSVGALDPYTVHGGYRLVRPAGGSLRPDDKLAAQGVEDGEVLSVEVGAEIPPPRVYDDGVEAVADAVERHTRPWSPAASARTALVTAVLALLLAAAVLFTLRTSGTPVALAAGVCAVLLVTTAAVLSRGQAAHRAGVGAAWCAAPFAAVAGMAALADRDWAGLPLLAAGAAVVVSAGLGIAALAAYRALLVPALALAGLAVAVAALVIGGMPVGSAAACLLALVVVLGSVVPWASLSTTRLRPPQPRSEAEILADPSPLDRTAVERQVRLGREVLIALTITVGAVLVLTAPLVVRLGVWGTGLVVVAAIVLILRARQYRDSGEVAVTVVSAVAALAAAFAAAALLHPGWRPLLAGILLAVGAVLIAVAVTPRTPNVRLRRSADVLEPVARVALLPLLVAALGFFPGAG